MQLSNEELIRRGRILVNISIILSLYFSADSVRTEIIQKDRTGIIMESIFTGLHLAIIVSYYLKKQFAIELVTLFAPLYIFVFPIYLIIPVLNLFDYVFIGRYGERAEGFLIPVMLIGIVLNYIIFFKFRLFKSVKEYRKSVSKFPF